MAGRVEKGGDNDAEVLHRPRRLRGRQPAADCGLGGVADAADYCGGVHSDYFGGMCVSGGTMKGGKGSE